MMSRPSAFWLILAAVATTTTTVVSSSSSDSNSRPFSFAENDAILNDSMIIGSSSSSRPRARIEEWQLSSNHDDDKDELLRRRRRRWQDDDELNSFPSLSQYEYYNSGVNDDEQDDNVNFSTNNNNNFNNNHGKSPHSLSLHLELPPPQKRRSSFGIRQSSLFPTDNHNNDNSNCNNNLKKKFKKTGTTIAGCVVKNHVLLAADTRATEATMVADKACQKLHQLATNSWCAGAGTSADLDHLTKECLYSLALQRLQESSIGNDNENENKNDDDDDTIHSSSSSLLLLQPVSTEALCNFFQDSLYAAGGQLGANLILGSVWKGKAQLRAIHPHGSMDVDLPFAALGSGGLAAMGVLEQGYHNGDDEMTVEEGIELVQRAILAGIRNDLGSGSQVDLCIIRPDGSSDYRRCVVPEEQLEDGYVVADTPSNSTTSSLLTAEHSEELGVNGFGNLPFAVQSKKTILSSDAEKEKLSRWNEILGLN